MIAAFSNVPVFEDFFGADDRRSPDCVDQRAQLEGLDAGNRRFISLLQREFGDVIYYHFALAPEFAQNRHDRVGHRVQIVAAPRVYRWLRATYQRNWGRWDHVHYRLETASSYAIHVSWPLIRTLLRDRPDAFFIQDYSTGRFDMLVALARILGVPLIARHAGSIPDHYRGRTTKRWTIPRAAAFIVSSHDELEMLAHRYRVPRERLWVILTPIDTAVFRPLDRAVACRAFGLDGARRYLLFVGRLEEDQKQVGALLRAFAGLAAAHADIDLLIAGDGPDGGMLRRLAAELAPGRVRFLGWIAETEALVRLYNTAECVVLPSRFEGFPSVVGEAMACGAPVAAARVGGVGEVVVHEETGWLFSSGDDEAFRRVLAFVMMHPEVVAAMRPRVRAVAEVRVSPGVVGAALRRCLTAVGVLD